jgi:hypothetical protein
VKGEFKLNFLVSVFAWEFDNLLQIFTNGALCLNLQLRAANLKTFTIMGLNTNLHLLVKFLDEVFG